MAGRPKLWPDKMVASFPENTFARIAAVIGEGGERTDYVRDAVAASLERDERRPGTLHRNPRRPAKGRALK